MKTIILLTLTMLLTGCNAFMLLPSVQHCQHVIYQRDYNHVTIAADCEVQP
jgi:hypothetical protein